MKGLFTIGLGVTLLAASVSSRIAPHREPPAQKSSALSQSPPAIALTKADDVAKIRKQAHGQVLVINFWATWCHGCVAEFPEFVVLDDHYRAKGVKVVGISFDKPTDIDSKVRPFISKSKARFDILVPDMDDPQPIVDAVTNQWTGEMPATFIFDKQGKLVYEHFGVIDGAEVAAKVESLLKG